MLKENEYAVPADGDEMTWDESTLSRDTAHTSEYALAKVWADDEGYDNAPLTYAALVATVYRLQDEVCALAAQVVELRERIERNEGEL